MPKSCRAVPSGSTRGQHLHVEAALRSSAAMLFNMPQRRGDRPRNALAQARRSVDVAPLRLVAQRWPYPAPAHTSAVTSTTLPRDSLDSYDAVSYIGAVRLVHER